jgi:hypothetical protein
VSSFVLFEDVDDVTDAIVYLLVQLADLAQLGKSGTLAVVGGLLFISALEGFSDHEGTVGLPCRVDG